MSMENLNNIFIIAAIAIGGFSVFIEWTYLFEAMRGIKILEFKVYKHYINSTFVMSTILLIFLWLTNLEISSILVNAFVGLMIAWFLTALVCLILSVFLKIKPEYKIDVRKALFPCITKVLWLVIVLWFIY